MHSENELPKESIQISDRFRLRIGDLLDWLMIFYLCLSVVRMTATDTDYLFYASLNRKYIIATVENNNNNDENKLKTIPDYFIIRYTYIYTYPNVDDITQAFYYYLLLLFLTL